MSKRKLTPQEYLDTERRAETKSEYWAGQVYAMAGASERHNSIQANTLASLVTQLRGRPCKAYGSDMRVKVERMGLYTYPDAVVVCGQPVLEDSHQDTLLNPSVIFEILSPSTEAYDRGAKFEAYRKLETLTDYVLISQDEALVEHYARQPDGRWLLTDYRGLEAVLALPSIQCSLPLAEIYDKVELPPSDERRALIRVLREQQLAYQAEAATPSPLETTP
ncbi:MAG: Uma2 family endonuclease [Caldilineales bacterium]|nr:Uma2 family endonuclease [Caldilineales bacterium]